MRAHPVYGSAAWLAVVNPDPAAEAATYESLRGAYDLARARHERRTGSNDGPAATADDDTQRRTADIREP
ncbi:DUF6194 family protein [Streptomyces sp. NBC_00876]|uniref:DUF6194 family protein n=1 Tax=Streptomyces sp. NBC_00876 TaxID=2975853 RepID=UPI003865A37B|nr:DUF6194 family protein [Streptomyces sp. NBC_00876]